MSQITRCPTCATLFKVVPDQLRISEGWVRCGECDEVFDAALHLVKDVPPAWRAAFLPPDQETLKAEVSIHASEGANLEEVSPLSDEIYRPQGGFKPKLVLDALRLEPMTEPVPELKPVAKPKPVLELASKPKPEPKSESEQVSVPLDVVPDVPEPIVKAAIPEVHAALDLDLTAPLTAIVQNAPVQAAHPDHQDISFLRPQKIRFSLAKSWQRRTLLLMSFALTLSLLGQIVWHERDRIVALNPALTPWMQTFCRPLNCTLSPLRRMESLVIDSSSFTRIRADRYRLNFIVKNKATLALATPALELTLTDALDQPVLRRVFLTTELGPHPDSLAAGEDWSISLAFEVKTNGSADRITGYRLLAFYP